MSLEAAHFNAGCGVPKPGCSVTTAGEQSGAVRSEGDACDRIFVSLEAANFGAGFGVPESDRPVIAAGEQHDAVRGEGDA